MNKWKRIFILKEGIDAFLSGQNKVSGLQVFSVMMVIRFLFTNMIPIAFIEFLVEFFLLIGQTNLCLYLKWPTLPVQLRNNFIIALCAQKAT